MTEGEGFTPPPEQAENGEIKIINPVGVGAFLNDYYDVSGMNSDNKFPDRQQKGGILEAKINAIIADPEGEEYQRIIQLISLGLEQLKEKNPRGVEAINLRFELDQICDDPLKIPVSYKEVGSLLDNFSHTLQPTEKGVSGTTALTIIRRGFKFLRGYYWKNKTQLVNMPDRELTTGLDHKPKNEDVSRSIPDRDGGSNVHQPSREFLELKPNEQQKICRNIFGAFIAENAIAYKDEAYKVRNGWDLVIPEYLNPEKYFPNFNEKYRTMFIPDVIKPPYNELLDDLSMLYHASQQAEFTPKEPHEMNMYYQLVRTYMNAWDLSFDGLQQFMAEWTEIGRYVRYAATFMETENLFTTEGLQRFNEFKTITDKRERVSKLLEEYVNALPEEDKKNLQALPAKKFKNGYKVWLMKKHHLLSEDTDIEL